jgi:DNA-directed RNA polymerase beta subunit
MPDLFAPLEPEPELSPLADPIHTRKAIFDTALTAASKLEPVTNSRHTLSLSDVHYEGPEHYTLADQKKAVLEGRSLSRKLRGTWNLTDNLSGQPIDQRKTTLAQIPYLTNRGTYINNGTEYGLSKQFRLRPGAYTHRKENGELETHVNVLPGKGFAHYYQLDPETGIFRARLSQAHIPLYSLLRNLGATDEQLNEAWGPELLKVNKAKDSPANLDKYYEKLVRKPDRNADRQAKALAVVEAMTGMQVDPKVSQRTLGKPYENISAEMILDSTKKLIALNKGEVDGDDRDHLANQQLMGAPELFAERWKRAPNIMRPILWKASARGSLDRVGPNAFSRLVQGALLESGLGQALEEIGPQEILDSQYKVTRMGEGALPSLDAVPKESRNVSPSHFGFVDPIMTPESGRVGIDGRLASALKRNAAGDLVAGFLDPRTGKSVWKSPEDVSALTLAFPGELEQGDDYVKAIQNGRLKFVSRNKVDLVLPKMNDGFGPMANMIPFKSNSKGQRVSMGARMLTQALSLTDPESPLVQSGMLGEADKSYEELYGEQMGAIRAKQPGRVLSVSPDEIKVQYADGKVESHELANNFIHNRKSVTGDTQIFVLRDGVIVSLEIRNYEWMAGDKTLSIDPDTKQSTWLPVTGYLKHENDKKLYRVTTASGRSVVVTEDHSLMTLGSEGHLEPIYPLDCVVKKTRLPVSLLPDCSDPGNQDFDLGQLVGLYLSEGHCPPSQPGLVMIAVDPDDRAEEVLSLLRRLGHRPYRSGGCIKFSDHERCGYLTSNFGHLSHAKLVPGWALRASTAFRSGLISGYMGGDGCLWADSHNAIQVTGVSVSKALRDGLVAVLSSLQIFCTLFDAPRSHLSAAWRDGYGFRVISRHLNRLQRWFFYSDREDRFRNLCAEDYRTSTFEMVPVSGKKLKKQLYTAFETTPARLYQATNKGAVSKQDLRQVEGVLGQWGQSDVMWDKVVAIEPVHHETWVYDLCVAKSEAFAVCQGLIVHNTFLNNTSTVSPGDVVQPGQLLATSNFTDKNGTTALGKNARVGFTTFRGLNFEDAIVVSESFAKRLSSEHAYQHQLDMDENTKHDRNLYMSVFPGKLTKQQLTNYDDQGVIKPGTKVHFGEPLILAARRRAETGIRIGRRKATYGDAAVTWDHHTEGTVTDIAQTKNGPLVVVKATNPLQLSDKISNRFGGKGVISGIIPDDQMPQDESGQPLEVLMNPLGLVSRTNSSQIAEMVLAKVAAKTGKPYKLPDFDTSKDLMQWVQSEASKNGVKDYEDIFDPGSQKKIKNILVGNQYILKLHHLAESKAQGRGLDGYTAERSPAKGGATGAKRIGLLDSSALLSHGAVNVLHDSRMVRGQENNLYWQQFMSGYSPQAPQTPYIWDKFINRLKGAGINVERQGNKLNLMALTNQHVQQMTGDRELKNAETIDWKTYKPVPGGLFDPGLTGGTDGGRWSFVRLPEPLPSPVMEGPIRKVLGLTEQKFRDVLAGREKLHDKTGPEAIHAALNGIDLDRSITQEKELIRTGKKSSRDDAIKRLHFLQGAKNQGLHPRDWVLNRVPVIPPNFRPISMLGSTKIPLVSDANMLYKEVLDAKDAYQALAGQIDDVGDERLAIYDAFKGVTGLGDPIQPKNQEQKLKGFLGQIFKGGPKQSTVQRQLLGSTVDLVGRAALTPNPDLDMDHVGIPEEQAWDIYKPFIIRRLVRSGMPRLQAAEQHKARSAIAKNMMLEEMGHRPVIINRAPVLHRFGIFAVWPVLTKARTIQMSPIVYKGAGADNDGDTMQFHIPATDAAREDAIEKMLPSKNLLAPSNFGVHYLPTVEYQGGAWAATRTGSKKREHAFDTIRDALAAHARGELDEDTPVSIARQ